MLQNLTQTEFFKDFITIKVLQVHCSVQTATSTNKNPFTVFQLLYTVGHESLHNQGALWRMYFSTTVHKRVSDGKIFNFHCSNVHTYTLHICANSNTKTEL